MKRTGFTFEPLCETDEKCEKLFSKSEMECLASNISRRILEAFHFLPEREIAFLLRTNSVHIKAFIEDGELPSTEMLLSIHKVTGVSIDWILTGQGAKYKYPVGIISPKKRESAQPSFNRVLA